MESGEISEGGKSFHGVNDKGLKSGCSILPLRNRIGLRKGPLVSKFHFERRDRLRPTLVEVHERQYKGRSAGAKSPGELYVDLS